MAIERDIFFRRIRSPLFGGRFGRCQVEGLDAILDRFEKAMGDGDLRRLAYMLATAHHETGRTMRPVRETFASSDDEAIAILDKAFLEGRLPQVAAPYWRRDAEGKSWLGRGLVQLTHRANYQRMSEVTGIDLVAEPARAMELRTAVDILIRGMGAGAFTGRRLADYFSGARQDWEGARRIINGRDRARQVAVYAVTYHAALRCACGDAVRATR